MVIQQIVNGITIGSTYALTAVGYTMVFGILELVNFSHGSVYMFGAYACLVMMTAVRFGFTAAFGVSVVATGLLGVAIDRLFIMPLRVRRAPKISALISTIGVSIFLQNLVMLLWGSETKNFPMAIDLGTVKVGPVRLSSLQVLVMGTALVLMLGLSYLIKKTMIGKAMRATAQNAEAAELMGVEVDTVISFTFFLGSALAAVAGVMVGMYYQAVDPMMGFMAGLKAFAAAVFGGIGVLPGAMLGGLLMGIAETFAAGYVHSGFRDAIAFGILICVLLVKPSGLLGSKLQKKV